MSDTFITWKKAENYLFHSPRFILDDATSSFITGLQWNELSRYIALETNDVSWKKKTLHMSVLCGAACCSG